MAKRKDDFETQLARLKAVIEQLETGALPLEKGVELYKEGQALVKSCREQLKRARHEIAVAGGGDIPDLEPLDGQDDLPDDEMQDEGGCS